MPRAAYKSKPSLAIKLEGNRLAYYSGDVINGCVYRTSSLSCADPYVYISLQGRTKAKHWIDCGGDGSIPLRSSLILLDSQRHRQKLSHVIQSTEDGSPVYEWCFALTIPTTVDEGAQGRKISFTPFTQGVADSKTLPASFTGVTESGGHEAYLEYFLQADLPVQGKAFAAHEAILPIKILSSLEQPILIDHLLQEQHHQLQVNSERLIPGMENHRPSFSERLKKTFAPKVDCRLSFQFDIQVPSVIQLQPEVPIPFLVSAAPLWDKTDGIIRNVPQKILIVGLNVMLHSVTQVKCERDQLGEWVNSIPLTHRLPLNPPLAIQCTGEREQPVDIGTDVNLQIPKKKPYEVTVIEIEPDYVAWNFRHSHRLEYELRCMVGGKAVTASGEQTLRILPPSNIGRF
uniref:Arrestin-like N-terminal domain-containing protein n=1 Tax=Bionectria ochroleuca TaxID=29856 RepID=A0A8H7TQ10_BIOOC